MFFQESNSQEYIKFNLKAQKLISNYLNVHMYIHILHPIRNFRIYTIYTIVHTIFVVKILKFSYTKENIHYICKYIHFNVVIYK